MASRLNLSKILLLGLLSITLLGAWHLGIAAKVYAKAWLADQLIERAWQKTLDGDVNVKPWPWADTWPIAELRLPRLGIKQIILSGDSGRVLAFGPGFSEATKLPGEQGLSLISGHRDTNFRFLKDIKLGDTIWVHRPNQRFSFTIEETAIVDQRNFRIDQQLVDEQQNSYLMFVTCYPFDALKAGGDLRFIVLAANQHKTD